MKHDDLKAILDAVCDFVKEYAPSRTDVAEKLQAINEHPAPKDGTSVTVDDVAPMIGDQVRKAVAEIPKPKDGPTADEVSKALEGKFAEWALGFERKADAIFQRAIDRMPEPAPGKDGQDFGGVEFDYDGARSITIRYQKDGETVEQTHRMPVVIDAGFYQEGVEYEKGDGTTFGGSYWIAQKDTSAKPEIGGDDWRLAVKKGRDGRSRGDA